MKKKGFTLIELLIVIGIISILAVIVLVSVSQSRKNTRINEAKTALRTILPAIIACKDGDGNVSAPVAGIDICTTAVGLTGAKWLTLQNGYAYGAGTYNSINCNFLVSTNGDSADLTCNCTTQACN